MNVIRMIKVHIYVIIKVYTKLRDNVQIFGWEPKTATRVADRREGELKYLKQFKLLEMSNGLLK